MSLLMLFVVLVLGGVAAALAGSGLFRLPGGTGRTRAPVDDFVVGDLPMVCARSGEPADGLVDLESADSRFQAWWLLLLFLGPIGIVAIVVLSVVAKTPGRVSGVIPMTTAALAEHNRAMRIASRAWLIPVVFLLIGGSLLMAPVSSSAFQIVGVSVIFAGLLGGFVVVFVAGWQAGRATVGVRLDGTGRWVELINVHSEFARAVDRQTRDRHRAVREHRDRF